MANAIFSPWSGYILYDAVWSGTAPMTSYALTTFGYVLPDWMVRWSATTVTVTATLAGGARKADLFALPMSNIDAGATKLALTNGAGLNVAITIPVTPTGPYPRLPYTAVCDLRPLASAGTRTSNVWNLVITANSVNVTMGGAIWLGTCVDFTKNFRYGLIQGSQFYNPGPTNSFGTVLRMRAKTRTRWCDIDVPARDAQRDAFMDWADSGEGAGLPSVFWPRPEINDALLGSFPDEISNTWKLVNYSPMAFRFTEWSKGLPL
jgi:hypothetical protein